MADSSDIASAEPHVQPLQVLADTNIVLDLFLKRDPWYTEAQPMWDERDAGHLFVYLAASVLTDIFYICRKQVGAEQARRIVDTCLHGFDIVPVDRSILETALALPGSDFEDNVLVVCAQVASLDLIITRNTADFRDSPIPAIAPTGLPSRLDT
ncbi:MAG TPA: PIN domain-containing protein [Ktedonobacterales bacterium]|nr:PIN domain-containing protein [Ktedonobacterales bacterium]